MVSEEDEEGDIDESESVVGETVTKSIHPFTVRWPSNIAEGDIEEEEEARVWCGRVKAARGDGEEEEEEEDASDTLRTRQEKVNSTTSPLPSSSSLLLLLLPPMFS